MSTVAAVVQFVLPRGEGGQASWQFFGGGALEAALFRPRTGYYADLIAEASALWESLSQHHPFIDGNKRTAFAVTYSFLVINGAVLTASASETEAFVMALYSAGRFEFEPLAAWLRANVHLGNGKK
jgi:death on curing protein